MKLSQHIVNFCKHDSLAVIARYNQFSVSFAYFNKNLHQTKTCFFFKIEICLEVCYVCPQSRWLMKEGYGGAMIWSLALDDFRKECRSSARPYPLLTTIYTLLTSLPPPTPTKTTKHTTLTSSSTTTAKTTTTTHFSFGV